MIYREVLEQVTQELKDLREMRSQYSTFDLSKGMKYIRDVKSLTDLQDKLINHVAMLEDKNVADIKSEFYVQI